MPEGEYKLTIGLEVHAELKTATKMFCNSKNDTEEERPNVNVCPVCLAHPGTLPVINHEAVKQVLRVGAAVGGTITDFTEFDRKNYFYPDIPKGYQISQYLYPLIKGGSLNGVALTRIHLEEDTAKSTHVGDVSLVDFNRAGVPLMELVTEPVIYTAEQAGAFARELQLLLQYLGAGDANLEKGEMRVEANISVSKDTTKGTKVEVKNINSFRAVEKTIAYEYKRQIEVIESGGKVVQETRGWDDVKEVTFSQRLKESAHDYRYFPDPDLPKLKLSEVPEFALEVIKKSLPELPWEKRTRYETVYGLKSDDVEVFVRPGVISHFFEAVCKDFNDDKALIKLASNYIISDLLGLMKAAGHEDLSKVNDQNFAALIKLVSAGTISSRGAKDILKIMFTEGGEPEAIANEKGLVQKSDTGELKKIAEEILAANPKVVEEFKSGKDNLLMFFVGQAMKATKGAGNPAVLQTIFKELLTK